MKKVVALVLALTLVLAAVPALAAGKLNVTQENFWFIDGTWDYGYCYARVENSGDKEIKVNAGVLEIYNADGDAITSTDYLSAYAKYLKPGEYTYVKMYAEVEGDVVPDDHMMTLTGKSDKKETVARLPVTTELALDVSNGYWTNDYMMATVTNNTDAPLYKIEVVLALLDAEGNILYIDSKDMYSELALMPGSSMIVRKEISSAFMEYFEANGIVPASVDAIAYVIVDVE